MLIKTEGGNCQAKVKDGKKKRSYRIPVTPRFDCRPQGAGSTSSPQDSIVYAGATGIPHIFFTLNDEARSFFI
jgi:hypothetical protein